MKKNYYRFRCTIYLGAFAMLLPGALISQQSYTFTNASATGSAGPTQAQVNTAYGSTNLSSSVVVNPQGIQNFTIPVSGPYRIEARGGQGYGSFGGRGAIIIGDFTLTAGTVLKIAVGQQGGNPIGSTNQRGGGGGSFVTYTNNVPLVVAGGGGGSWAGSFQANSDGTVSSSGNAGLNGAAGNGAGGTNGGGGTNASFADAGAGITGNGGGTAGGMAFVNGANGGADRGQGGFGGGGGTSSWDNYRGGGGGGYSGGGASASNGQSGTPQGGGGGSFNNGVNQSNTSGANLSHGKVIITELCPLSIWSNASNSLNPVICTGTTLTLTTSGVSNYSWSTGNTTSSVIVVTPTVTTTYSVIATTSINCSTAAFITVTVSSGMPVITYTPSSAGICLGDSIAITAGGALTYTWSHGMPNGALLGPTVTTTYSVSGQNGCGTTNSSIVVTVSPLPVLGTASPTLICENTTTTLSATGATTYTWMPGNMTGSLAIGGATANTVFTVTGRTGNCLGVHTVAVNTKPNPTLTIVGSATNVCIGQSVTLTVSGADTYTWTPSILSGTTVVASPTAPTAYMVLGTNSVGCTTGAQHIIVTQSPPVINGNLTSTVICKNGSTLLSASGAASYTWSHGPLTASTLVSPSTNTVYTVTGSSSSNTCTASRSFTVSVAEPVLGISPSTAICQGAAVTLTTGPGNGIVWSPGGSTFPSISVNPAATTLYSVNANVTTGSISCPASNTVLVTVNPNPTVSVTATSTVICRNNGLVITASGASSYSWSTNATTPVITFSSGVVTTHSVTATGTDANGCKGTGGIQVKVNSCNAIGELGVDGGISIYPNPSGGIFFIKSGSAATVTFFNALGQQVGVIQLDAGNGFQAEVNGLADGVYVVRAQAGATVTTKTVIVKH